MAKIQIGILGCGNISDVHSASLMRLCGEFDVEVAAFADPLPGRRAFMAERFPDARQYESAMGLVAAEKLDIALVLLPTYLHAEHAIAAMERGMNVFMEKPVCLKRSEAKKLLEAERKSGKKAMVGQVVRFFSEYIYLKDLYEKQAYGRLKSIVLQRLTGGPKPKSPREVSWFRVPEKSGTAVLDFHIHDVDFMRSLLGEPQSVSVTSDASAADQPTHIAAVYGYKDTFALAEGTWGHAPAYRFGMGYRANFERATVVYNSMSTPTVTLFDDDGGTLYPEMPKPLRSPGSPGYKGAGDAGGVSDADGVGGEAEKPGGGPYYEEFRYFLECVIADRPVAEASLADAVKTYELTMTELEMAYAQAGAPFPFDHGE